MQEVAPAPPAQIMTSEMLLPQCCLHSSLDSRGRAACCRLLGVLGAMGQSPWNIFVTAINACYTDNTHSLSDNISDGEIR